MKLTDPESAWKAYINREKLYAQKLLLMVSGGVDSMVMLYIAAKLHRAEQLHVLTVDHGTETGLAHSQFVAMQCEKSDIKYTKKTLVHVPDNDAENHWRKARKAFADEVQSKEKCAKILTAHHATDLTETVLFRLAKGCGPSGLAPLHPYTKPFLSTTKQAIRSYATEHKVPFLTDPSNAKLLYERNRIRHEVLPALRHITPNLEAVMLRNSEIFRAYHQYIHSVLPSSPLPLDLFLALPDLLQNEWLLAQSPKSVSGSDLADCLRWLKSNPTGNTKKKLGSVWLTYSTGSITPIETSA